MPPSPPDKPFRDLPPHPARVAQRKQPFGASFERPPHPAAVVQPRAAPGERAGKALPPHPATMPMISTVQPRAAEERQPPHPAIAERSPSSPPAAARPAQAPSDARAPDSDATTAQPYLMSAGAAIGAYFGAFPGFVIGGALGALLEYGWGAYARRQAMAQAFSTIAENLGYVAVACVRHALATAAPAALAARIAAVVAANGAIARAYTLVQGLFGGPVIPNPTQGQLRALINLIDANILVNGWGSTGTSDPRNDNLNVGTAKLIVHAFTPYALMNDGAVPAPLNAYRDNAVVTGIPGRVAVRTCAAYLQNAAHPGGNYCLSTSLIGKVRRNTIGPVGIVLNVPAWNLLLIGPRDLNIDNGAFGAWTPFRLCAGQVAPRQISANGTQTSLEAIEAYTPDQLIAATHNYNELGVLGPVCLRGTEPVVTGIFVVVKNGRLCEDGGYMDQAVIDAIDPNPASVNHRIMRHKSYYRHIGQLGGGMTMTNRIAQSAARHRIPIVVINNPHTNLPESNVALAGLTANGGAWHGLTVVNF
jgi:hypothetical protein